MRLLFQYLHFKIALTEGMLKIYKGGIRQKGVGDSKRGGG